MSSKIIWCVCIIDMDTFKVYIMLLISAIQILKECKKIQIV